MDPVFDSDGCTGFPEVLFGIDLTQCCYAHDLAWFNNPGDWVSWFFSNIDLVVCFTAVGAWWVAVPAFIAVSSVGALIFARPRRKKAKPDGQVR